MFLEIFRTISTGLNICHKKQREVVKFNRLLSLHRFWPNFLLGNYLCDFSIGKKNFIAVCNFFSGGPLNCVYCRFRSLCLLENRYENCLSFRIIIQDREMTAKNFHSQPYIDQTRIYSFSRSMFRGWTNRTHSERMFFRLNLPCPNIFVQQECLVQGQYEYIQGITFIPFNPSMPEHIRSTRMSRAFIAFI